MNGAFPDRSKRDDFLEIEIFLSSKPILSLPGTIVLFIFRAPVVVSVFEAALQLGKE